MNNDGTKVTELELKILQQIWEKGKAMTVAEIVEKWPDKKKPGYTTVLKTLQKMEKKAIVGHRREGRKYEYFSVVSKEKVTQNRLNSIIDRMFSSSRLSFAEYFVRSNDFTAEELGKLKELIIDKEKEERE
ncbi:MAG: BlaI/MecI/CopY family transcriptional regulator [Proteobacteria bacterium]|nr:BlaI/MecI/CopY family transcriptional regulator [Pseudomonadota bacterium]